MIPGGPDESSYGKRSLDLHFIHNNVLTGKTSLLGAPDYGIQKNTASKITSIFKKTKEKTKKRP